MECPKCYARTSVYNGYADEGCYVRRRQCPECGHRFITVERAAPYDVQGNGRRGGKRIKSAHLLTSKEE